MTEVTPLATPGTVVSSGALITPGGPPGPGGPTAVSTDTGNLAVLGSDSLILVPRSSIEMVGLRSYNAVGNPNFEIDSRNCGALFTGTSYGAVMKVIDRWNAQENGSTMDLKTQQISQNVVVPGTSFLLHRKFSG